MKDKSNIDIALRITRPYSDLASVFQSLEAEKIVVYQHDDSNRVHIHALILNCPILVIAVKRRIEKVLGKVNASDWSFKTSDITDNFITYMSKGKLDPLYVKGFDADKIDGYRLSWVAPKKQSKLSVKDKTQTFKDIINEVCAISKDLDYQNYQDIKFVVQNLVLRLNKNDICTSRYKIRDLVETVFRKQSPESYVDNLMIFLTK